LTAYTSGWIDPENAKLYDDFKSEYATKRVAKAMHFLESPETWPQQYTELPPPKTPSSTSKPKRKKNEGDEDASEKKKKVRSARSLPKSDLTSPKMKRERLCF
jgi:hypothetical protein